MSEKGCFIVDSTGETAFQEAARSDSPVLRMGKFVIPLGDQALTPEQIGNSKYFAEPGGRIIDTETGAAVTHGDGSTKISLEDIEDYEDRTK
ncbi:MAG: hypothetical protein ACR2FM_04700 [Candidatus Saccharimonadales bacterium]